MNTTIVAQHAAAQRLAEAAPELLAALKTIVREHVNGNTPLAADIAVALAAIDRAEGV